jgi:hypothetical protein
VERERKREKNTRFDGIDGCQLHLLDAEHRGASGQDIITDNSALAIITETTHILGNKHGIFSSIIIHYKRWHDGQTNARNS